MRRRDPFLRFYEKTEIQPDGCVLWTGSRDGFGYGMFQSGSRRSQRAHRWLWERLEGPVPEGLQLDHLCRTPACINLAHLEPVTCRENILRGTAPAAQNARKTLCIRGHRFAPEITTGRHARRKCPTCDAATKRLQKERQRADRLHALTGGALRQCEGPNCVQSIPDTKRIGTLYCSPRCRLRAFHARLALLKYRELERELAS